MFHKLAFLAATVAQSHGMPCNTPHSLLSYRALKGPEAPFDVQPAASFDSDAGRSSAALGFSFSPAGLLFPYHLGVATRLREAGVIQAGTPLAGSSAGALVAVMIGGCRVQRLGEKRFCAMTIAFFCFQYMLTWINADWAKAGFREPLRGLVKAVLDELLPPDAHERLNRRPGRVRIAITQIDWSRPRYPLKPQVIQQFNSRDDLIEVLLASCCVPFWFTPGPFIICRGLPSVDGFFAVPPSRFGCPPVPARREILVSPFPATQVTRGGGGQGTGDVSGGKRDYEWLSPELDGSRSRAGMRELLRDALVANNKEMVVRYYELGRQDATFWLRKYQEN